MRCDHNWQILDDIYAYKCSTCLEVRWHPTDKDDCLDHEYEMLADRSGVSRCRKCFKKVWTSSLS